MTFKLDKKDKKILSVLNKNARKSVAAISKETGIQRDSIMYRIKRMEKASVILHYHAVLDSTLLGKPIYSFVMFELIYSSEDEKNRLLGFLKEHKNVTYVAKTTGKWDLIVNVAARDLKEFDAVLVKIRMNFSAIIKDYQTASIIDEIKYDDMVELIDIN